MPGFWEQLQQYAQQDQMRKQYTSARELELAKMLGGFAESDSANALNYAQMQNQSLAARGGLLQAIAQMQQTDKNAGNSLIAGERQLASSERNNDNSNSTSLKTAKMNTDAFLEVEKARLYLEAIKAGLNPKKDGSYESSNNFGIIPTGERKTLVSGAYNSAKYPTKVAAEWLSNVFGIK